MTSMQLLLTSEPLPGLAITLPQCRVKFMWLSPHLSTRSTSVHVELEGCSLLCHQTGFALSVPQDKQSSVQVFITYQFYCSNNHSAIGQALWKRNIYFQTNQDSNSFCSLTTKMFCVDLLASSFSSSQGALTLFNGIFVAKILSRLNTDE